MLPAFVIVSGGSASAKEKTNERVEFNECEAITERRPNRNSKKKRQPAIRQFLAIEKFDFNISASANLRSFTPITERDNVNGCGSHLLI